MTAPYITTATGERITFAEIAERVRREAPGKTGRHIFEQLDAIGLRETFDRASTPFGLPYSFVE